MLVSIVFIPIGVASLFASRDVCSTEISLFFFFFFFFKPFIFLISSCIVVTQEYLVVQVVEIVDRYETECVPTRFRDDKVQYIQSSEDKLCNRTLTVSVLFVYHPPRTIIVSTAFFTFGSHRRFLADKFHS